MSCSSHPRARRTIAALMLVCLSLQSTGCLMAFQYNDARDAKRFHAAQNEQASDAMSLSLIVTLEVAGAPTTERARRRRVFTIAEEAWTLIQHTGAYRVQADALTADRRLEIQIHKHAQREQSTGLYALSLFTVFLIPWIERDRYTTRVRLLDAAGEEIASRTYKHHLEEVIQFFLLFGLPLRQWPDRVRDRMWQEVLQDIAVWLAEEVG